VVEGHCRELEVPLVVVVVVAHGNKEVVLNRYKRPERERERDERSSDTASVSASLIPGMKKRRSLKAASAVGTTSGPLLHPETHADEKASPRAQSYLRVSVKHDALLQDNVRVG
jgi:hypothetical protein